MTTTTMPTTAPETRTTSDVLLAAARRIEEHGWFGLGEDGPGEPGRYCAQTAIYAVTDDATRDHIPAMRRLNEYLGHPEAGETCRHVWDWNDTPGRTEAEVLAALREAAR